MKAFGYAVSDVDAEQPRELRELTLSLSVQEIELIVEFLQQAKRRFEAGSPTPGESHFHLRDWWKGWNASVPDLIIAFDQ
jgi:hypothetical protein